MPINRKPPIDRIIELLSGLAFEIESAGGLHLYDRNKVCEEVYKHIFNKVYGYKLENINITQGENFPAIDLGDAEKGLSIQITSDGSSTKITKTLKLFCEKKLYETYSNLTIYNITKKKGTYRSNFSTTGGFVFEKETDIKDKEDLIRYIAGLDVDKIKDICDLVEKELGGSSNQTTVANEVETIMDFIAYLSENKSDGEQAGSEDPDPEKKITERFAEHSEYLKQEIADFTPIYKNARQQAESKLGIDKVMVTLMRRYLMDQSIQVLDENELNPKKALDALVEYFAGELSKNGKRYDQGAIRYYLLQEIVNCNVFPNPIN
jgi:hypothetical protein